MQRTLLAVTLGLGSLSCCLTAQGVLYSVTSGDGLVRAVDPLTATTLSAAPLTTSTGQAVTLCNGLARDPATGLVYGIVRTIGSTRQLAIVVPQLALCFLVGSLGDNFAGLTFAAGRLYGVTGDGAVVPSALFTIDVTTAVPTFVRSFGSGTFGESIASAPDGFLYHASGFGVQNVDEVFERLDLGTNTLANVPLSGFDFDEILAMSPWAGNNLIASDLNDDLVAIDTTGHVSLLGVLDHSFVKGLVFVPDTTAFYEPYAVGCAASNAATPLLFGSGLPSPGQAGAFELVLAPPGTIAVLGIGTGNTAVPFPTPSCQLAINPLAQIEVYLTNGAGAVHRGFTLPPTFPTADLFLQVGLLDGPNLVLSNALHMHIQ